MNRPFLLAAASVIGLIAPGCGSTMNQPDGANLNDASNASDASDASSAAQDATPMGEDASGDAGSDSGATSRLFLSCASNVDCNVEGARGLICDTKFPGGMCTRTCTRDGDCGMGTCLGAPRTGQCFPSCSIGGGECAATQVCVQSGGADPNAGACVASCYPADAMAPSGSPMCAAGTTCDPGFSTPSCQSMASTGAANGSACRADDECLGDCIPEIDSTSAPTGYLGGQCFSRGRVPNLAMYVGGMPLPRGNCPAGSVILPANNGGGEGDLGVCLPSCSTNADCNSGRTPDAMGRTGYFCDLDIFSMPPQPSTGVCSPINCSAAPFSTMPNGGCPEGSACRPNPRMPAQGLCVRNP